MRYPSRFISIFSLAALAGATSAYAGPVNGRVVDPDGRPVATAQVLLVGTGMPVRSTSTNAHGEFTLMAPDSGRYELRVAIEGFRAEPVVVEGSATARDVGSFDLTV